MKCYRRLTSPGGDLKDGLAEQQNWGMSLPARSPLTDVGAKAARILDQAQAMADQLRAETRAEVLEILRRHEAERTAAEDLAAANAQARQELADTRDQARQRMSKADEEARSTMRDASSRAARLVAGAEQTCDQLRADATAEARQIIQRSRNEAEQILAEARKAAEEVAKQQHIEHEKLQATWAEQRQACEKDIAARRAEPEAETSHFLTSAST